jgi:hypothetical protein
MTAEQENKRLKKLLNEQVKITGILSAKLAVCQEMLKQVKKIVGGRA